MKIKVFMNTLEKNHILYVNDKKRDYVLLDRKETSYDADRFIFMIGTMVQGWPKELINENIVDGLEYKIVIKKGEEETTYRFKNKFPEDIYRLEMLIDDVAEEVKHV